MSDGDSTHDGYRRLNAERLVALCWRMSRGRLAHSARFWRRRVEFIQHRVELGDELAREQVIRFGHRRHGPLRVLEESVDAGETFGDVVTFDRHRCPPFKCRHLFTAEAVYEKMFQAQVATAQGRINAHDGPRPSRRAM
jgi:hypothetical protein